MTKKRAIVFSGGRLNEEDLHQIQPDDFIIGADKGALFLIEHGITPHVSVGDFDSITPEEKEKVELASQRMIACDPVLKDLTDTELALEIAMDEHVDHVLLLGVTGTRMDHTLANVQILVRAMQHHISCAIMDAHNYIELTGSTLEIQPMGYTYTSLLPMTAEVTGIQLEGFMYPLHNATLKMGQSRAVSNKLTASKGTISIKSGLLLVIQSKD
ncbi:MULTISPECIES: thiamine diphosphokinase [Paenibacillus]|uniref:thiamine diphosphokinase n=1 Tax=Paenibacillus TaxID=44249 RepID=UPI00083E6B4E|nr:MULTISPECIES: thiamine diphosphokinase [Paenibacillus]APQ59735.1 thiamine pyrophosphokinase [Paenibacillus polymyxa]ODB59843.1 thiamine pyrophosphokinase [Paenibacillus polymyxa]OMF71985.1 thiamine diphosphokinase [Paenibacillus peoriae]OMF72315.1 thiamine diphosphokinase [Paenibacillus peoriae]WCM59151.1 thiamine diphosphokinase [Paenibacillus polymyxa]